jgi:penicillin-binding protein 1A
MARTGTRARSGATGRASRSRRAGVEGEEKRARSRLVRFLRWARRGAVAAVVLVVVGAVGLGALVTLHGRDLPDVEQLRSLQEPQVTRIVDREGVLLGELFEERRTVVPLQRVPRSMVLSLLAAEDADFYRHRGVDYPGLVRAVVRGVFSGGRFRGTSTLTQQVVKNLLLTSERTVARKLREVLLARRVEAAFGKDEILEIYLNHVNFGHGRYGVQEAAQFYFGVDVEELSLAQASLLAGIPQSPTHLSPRTDMAAARRRQAFVLDQLAAKRAEYWPDLTLEEIEAARGEEIVLVPRPEADTAAFEVVNLARRRLVEQVGEVAARRGGYTVITTVDLELQRQARDALRRGLMQVDARQRLRGPLRVPRHLRPLEPVRSLAIGPTYDARVVGTDDEAGTIALDVGGHSAVAELEDAARFNPEGLAPSAFAPRDAPVRVTITRRPDDGPAAARLELGPEGAVVVLDPRTREVLALVGGSVAGPGFDRARQAERQPGSTFKPFVYTAALTSRRFTPATVVLDAPGVYDDWRPGNYETWSFRGEIRLREALAGSINQVAVRVMEDVGPPAVVELARRLGITTPLEPSLALSLGASEVRPLELTNAYATFAAGGRWALPRVVRRILGPDGREVPLPATEPPRDVLTPAEAYLTTSMLTSVVEHGTARRARRLGRPAAGKTGTSNEVRDAWFVGFTAERVAGVWVGFDDRRPLGRRESGGRTALPIWVEVMESANAGLPRLDFARPDVGLETATIDPASGLLAYEGQEGALEEVFLEGTAPVERASRPDELDTGSFVMEQLGGGVEDASPPEEASP